MGKIRITAWLVPDYDGIIEEWIEQRARLIAKDREKKANLDKCNNSKTTLK